MKKIFNFRPMVLFAISIVAAVLLATFVFASKNLRLSLLIVLSFSAICVIICVFIFKTKFLKFVMVCLLLSSFVVGQMYVKTNEFNDNKKYDNEELVVHGRICSNYKFTSSGNLGFYIDKVELVGANFKDSLDGKIAIYLSPDSFDLDVFEIGKNIAAFGLVRMNTIEDDSDYSLSNLSNGIVGSCYISYNKITIKSDTNKHFDESVRHAVLNKLKSFDIEYADIGYAMMFGDSTSIDADVQSAFRSTGIAHLLAVSGLHVGIIAFLISLLLNLFKLPKKANFYIMLCLLAGYCYLCDFSVSVVRASIMVLLMIYLNSKGKCYDRLTALSFALCVILIANPLKLFSVSLILSFLAVLSITLLTKVFEDLFDKCLHKKLSGSLALIFAVQVGLVFVQLYFFKKYTPLSLICNFISIPIATFAFVVLIFGIIISCVLPFMKFICLIYDFLMGLVVKFNFTMSKLGLIVSTGGFNFLIVVFGLMIIVLISNFIFIKKRYKAVGVSLFLILGSMLFWL